MEELAASHIKNTPKSRGCFRRCITARPRRKFLFVAKTFRKVLPPVIMKTLVSLCGYKSIIMRTKD